MRTIQYKTMISYLLFAGCYIIAGCSRTDFLDAKPNHSLLIPSTLDHYQALLDSDGRMNGADGRGITPHLGESGADNFYLLDQDFNTFIPLEKQNYYIWSENPYTDGQVQDWQFPYQAIMIANTVIEGLESIDRNESNQDTYDYIHGQALFHRAHFYHSLAQVFAPPYNPDMDNIAPSVPLRLSSDINEVLTRSTVDETYQLIIQDLSQSIRYLNDEATYKTRPSKQAAYGMMARVYLSMRKYELAKLYADSCLSIQNALLDFNTVDTTALYPFQGIAHPVNQVEVIFHAVMLSDQSQNFPTSFAHHIIDTNLYSLYHEHDLRRSVFFQKRTGEGYRFRGSYNYRSTLYFSGLAVDEITLARAECNARIGNVNAALDDLNRLLIARWSDEVYYEPYQGLSAQDALEVILSERRKELVFRGLRWSDLRRLNQEDYNISLIRNLNGNTYTLPSNDPRWTWPFPTQVLIN